ncbi:hypothetical protein AMEJIAPC_01082 [Caulobacter sp. NIBR1757]|nr:hypothetical protein AMEJIAPC_01082 [Caulobacter sp. NIBR1757]
MGTGTSNDGPVAAGEDPTTVIVAFIRSIGLRIETAPLTEPTVLPGMTIRRGVILYDPALPYAPADLLHEAGHLAVIAAEDRERDPFDATGGEELMGTAWSWAAGVHLGLPSDVVFHPPSFQNSGDTLRESFDDGRYVGTPGLHRFGMTIEPRRRPIPTCCAGFADQTAAAACSAAASRSGMAAPYIACTRARMSGGAVSGRPALNGGAGAYSRPSCRA